MSQFRAMPVLSADTRSAGDGRGCASTEYSAVKVPTRPSSRRPGVFATISAELTFEEMTPRDRVWAPSGMAGRNVGFDNATDDVELPPEKDSGRRHGGVQKSNKNLKLLFLLFLASQYQPAGSSARRSLHVTLFSTRRPPQPQTHATPSTPPPQYLPE